MSETKAKAAKAVSEPVGPAEAKPVARYEISKLRDKCATLFNVPPSTFDGAFYGRTGQYSREEAQEIITTWLNKPASL